jgi:heptosyltransferase-1
MEHIGERILIVKTSSMGDVVHALPLASDLARRFPGVSIDWLVEEAFAAIPRLHRNVDRVITVAVRRWRRSPGSLQTWREIHAAKAHLRAAHYGAILDCQGLLKSAWLARWARGPRWGFDRFSAREPAASLLYTHAVSVARDRHAIDRNRALGAAACGTDVAAPPSFDLQAPPIRKPALSEATTVPFAVLLTNASRASKLWPDHQWRDVGRELHARGLRCVLFAGSTAEEEATRRRADGMVEAWVAPRSEIEQVAAVLARARLVVGLDTGLSHLAAALGAPTLGIYCDYDPRLVGVTGPGRCTSLGGVGVAPTGEDVIAAMDLLLAGGVSAAGAL